MVTQHELLDRAREMRRNPTEWKKRLWRHLSNSQIGHKFRRQQVVFPYICDLFCPAKGLIVEIDGDTHDPPYDERRDARLSRLGFLTLRFTNIDIRDNIEGVVLTIATALAERPDRWSGLHPNPSPEGEGLCDVQGKPLPFRRSGSAMPPAWPEQRGALFTRNGVGGGGCLTETAADHPPTPQ